MSRCSTTPTPITHPNTSSIAGTARQDRVWRVPARDAPPASDLAREYSVSEEVIYSALAMLAANRYIAQPGRFTSYRVTWPLDNQGQACDGDTYGTDGPRHNSSLPSTCRTGHLPAAVQHAHQLCSSGVVKFMA
jgi:hypothetical protein